MATMDPVTTRRSLWILYLAVFVDLLGVALVVPNLVHRFRELGGSPSSFGVLSSAYAASQLVGGLLIGYLGDCVIGRKKTLLISFVGAGVSYLVVGLTHTLPLLVVSRVLVGLTKQTMTVSTALVAELTSEEVRTESLGRLSSATTPSASTSKAIWDYAIPKTVTVFNIGPSVSKEVQHRCLLDSGAQNSTPSLREPTNAQTCFLTPNPGRRIGDRKE